MYKLLFTSVALAMVAATSLPAHAQTVKQKEKKDDEEIIIRKKKRDQGDNEKYTIVIDGDNVTINGKPLDEFNGKDVDVIRRRGSTAFVLPPNPRMFMAPGGTKLYRPERLKFNKAFLGVTGDPGAEGTTIKEVTKGSAAEKAGLQKGDIITKVGSTGITDSTSLADAIRKYEPGDTVAITYKRDGTTHTTNAVLGKFNLQFHFDSDNNWNFDMPDFNFDLQPGNPSFGISRFHKPHAGLQVQETENGQGLKILDVQDDSPAEKAGLQDGDIITSVNGKKVQSLEDVRSTLSEAKEGDSFDLEYTRSGKQQKTTLKFPKKLRTSNL